MPSYKKEEYLARKNCYVCVSKDDVIEATMNDRTTTSTAQTYYIRGKKMRILNVPSIISINQCAQLCERSHISWITCAQRRRRPFTWVIHRGWDMKIDSSFVRYCDSVANEEKKLLDFLCARTRNDQIKMQSIRLKEREMKSLQAISNILRYLPVIIANVHYTCTCVICFVSFGRSRKCFYCALYAPRAAHNRQRYKWTYFHGSTFDPSPRFHNPIVHTCAALLVTSTNRGMCILTLIIACIIDFGSGKR